MEDEICQIINGKIAAVHIGVKISSSEVHTRPVYIGQQRRIPRSIRLCEVNSTARPQRMRVVREERNWNTMKLGFTEPIMVTIVAMEVIGPDKLPEYARKLGNDAAGAEKVHAVPLPRRSRRDVRGRPGNR